MKHFAAICAVVFALGGFWFGREVGKTDQRAELAFKALERCDAQNKALRAENSEWEALVKKWGHDVNDCGVAGADLIRALDVLVPEAEAKPCGKRVVWETRFNPNLVPSTSGDGEGVH